MKDDHVLSALEKEATPPMISSVLHDEENTDTYRTPLKESSHSQLESTIQNEKKRRAVLLPLNTEKTSIIGRATDSSAISSTEWSVTDSDTESPSAFKKTDIKDNIHVTERGQSMQRQKSNKRRRLTLSPALSPHTGVRSKLPLANTSQRGYHQFLRSPPNFLTYHGKTFYFPSIEEKAEARQKIVETNSTAVSIFAKVYKLSHSLLDRRQLCLQTLSDFQEKEQEAEDMLKTYGSIID